MRSVVLVGRARELIVSIESHLHRLFLQDLSTVSSLDAADITLSIKYVKVSRDRNFCQNALGRWLHLQLRAVSRALETSLHFVICEGSKPLLDQSRDVSGSPLDVEAVCPELPDQRARAGAW